MNDHIEHNNQLMFGILTDLQQILYLFYKAFQKQDVSIIRDSLDLFSIETLNDILKEIQKQIDETIKQEI